MKAWLATVLAVCAGLASGCQSLGPHPELTVLETEIKATRKVDRILVLPTTGIGPTKADEPVTKVVPAGAYERYGDVLVVAAGLEEVLDNLEMPTKDVLPLLPVNWQSAFITWVQQGAEHAKKKGDEDAAAHRPKDEMQLAVPSSGKKVAKSDKDLKHLSQALRKRKKAYEFVDKAVASGNDDELVKATARAHKQLVPVENLLRHLVQRLQITYLIVSDVTGDRAAFDKDQKITLQIAMVNTETGKFRYLTYSAGKKSDLPTTYEGLLNMMAHNAFEDVGSLDGVK